MIRLLVQLGKWLDLRFPEKLAVTRQSYDNLKEDVQKIGTDVRYLSSQIDTINQRLSVVETNAVHKGAVNDLIQAVKLLKDEYVSLKASLGMNRIGDASIRAMLNGEPLEGDDNV